ncbi:transporter substrate-binding domain-containing protein, partial [bacterium]|nr:transporter substrate-binding domain-containing protein [bacterium]
MPDLKARTWNVDPENLSNLRCNPSTNQHGSAKGQPILRIPAPCVKGTTTAVFALLFFLTILCRPAHAHYTSTSNQPNLQANIRDTLIVGGDQEYPPYEFLDEAGNPQGYNVDLTRAIAAELGLEVEIRLGPWSEVRKALESGEIDAVHGMFYSRERDRTFDFSQAHTIIRHVAVVRDDAGDPPADVEELRGQHLVVMRGDIMHEFVLEQRLTERLTVVDTQKEALRAVLKGRSDCALVAKLPALYWINEHEWNDLVVGRFSFLSPAYCYAVASGRESLLQNFGEGLKILEESGAYREIYSKWLGVYEEPSFDLFTALRYSAVVIIPLLVILLLVLLWSRTLSRVVRQRTAELEESRAFFQAALEQSRAGIAIADMPDGKLRFVNQTGLMIRGKTAAEVVNDVDIEKYVESWQILYMDGTPYNPSDVPLARAVLYGETCSEEFIVRRDSDEDRVVLANAGPIHNAKGERIAGIVVFTDITDRKRMEEELRNQRIELTQIFEAFPDSLVYTDTERRITRVNSAFVKEFGFQPGEVIGKQTKVFYARSDDFVRQGKTRYNLQAVKNYNLYEIEYRRKNGETFPAETLGT